MTAPGGAARPGSRGRGALEDATFSGVRWVAVTRVVAELALLGSMVVLARLISPAEFGMFAVALVVQEVALGLAGEGIGTPLVQRDVVEREHKQAALFLSLAVGAALAALALVAAPLVVAPIFGEEVVPLVQLSVPMCLLAGLVAVPQALLQRRLDFRRISIVRIVATLVRAATTLALALAGLDAEALVLGGVIATAVTAALMLAAAPVPPPWPHVQELRAILSFGVPAASAGLTWTAFRNADYLIVAAKLGNAAAGIYWRAFQLALEYQRKVSSVMFEIAFPVYSRAANVPELFALRQRLVRTAVLVIYPGLALLAVTAPTLVPWLFGEAWREAVVPTQVLTVAGAATLLTDAMGAVLFALGRPRSVLAYNLAYMATFTLAVLVAAPFGLTAVCLAVAAVYVTFAVAAYGVLLRGVIERPLTRLAGDVVPAVTCSAAVVAAGVAATAWLSARGVPALPELALVSLAGLAAYTGALRLAFPADFVALTRRARRLLLGRRRDETPAAPLAGATSP